ncbi:MAG: hypothetical protein ACR2OE_12795 [Thermomicrobiales bacterium]
MTTERLRITLPKAIDLGNLQIGSRQFDIQIFVNGQAAYEKLRLTGLEYTPVVAKVQLWTYQGGVEMSQVGGADGTIPYYREIDQSDPLRLTVFNLTVETEIHLTLLFDGDMMRRY